MNGLADADGMVTLVAAIATIVVLGGMLGERRVFGWTQHLFAGLVTGYLVVLAVSEVVVTRVIEPLAADPTGRPELWVGGALLVAAAAAPWLPRLAGAVPISVAIGGVAAFALGGAVVGTILPQLSAATAGPTGNALSTVVGATGAGITGLVLVGFVRGEPRGRVVDGAARLGRWLMLIGIGGWLGWLLLSRLVLLVDRLSFLLGDWLGIGR
jgi:hypothetical protein